MVSGVRNLETVFHFLKQFVPNPKLCIMYEIIF